MSSALNRIGVCAALMLIVTFMKPFLHNIKNAYVKSLEPHTKVGYVELQGFISDSATHLTSLKKLFKDTEIKAILMKIESTGGTSGSSESLFREIIELKGENPKPLVVVTENICASGGYWVACAADHIIACPVAWVGSIGATIPFRFKLKGFINEHNIQYLETTAGTYKNFSDPFVDSTPPQEAMLQELCNQTYQEFARSVASRRSKLTQNNINEWANGRVFLGRQAVAVGLVDAVGSKTSAINWIREKALIEGKIEWIKPERPSPWASFFGQRGEDDEEVSVATNIIDGICTRVEQRYFGEKRVCM